MNRTDLGVVAVICLAAVIAGCTTGGFAPTPVPIAADMPPMPPGGLVKSPVAQSAMPLPPPPVLHLTWECPEPSNYLGVHYMRTLIETAPTPAGPWRPFAIQPYGAGNLAITNTGTNSFQRVSWFWR